MSQSRMQLEQRRLLGVAVLVVLTLAITSIARAESDDDFFEGRVRPLLVKHCLECHGAKKQEGGLRLDSRAGWMRGGDRGAAIIANMPKKSLLIRAITYRDPDLQMPPESQLNRQEVAVLETWVKRGAPDPRRESTQNNNERMGLEQARTFWSFQPLSSTTPPQTVRDGWSRNPIDGFILAELKKHGLSPSPQADRRTLIRRATFDLTGLPPTPREIESFLRDESPQAFAKLVDRLLEKKAYGERWGRHWLDIARYADTAGDGADYPVREAVKYRDWVIDAIHRDKPFNEFVREQIAGDILARQGPAEKYADRVIATGFLAIGKRYGYKASPDYQHLDFADVIDSLGRSLLGLSLGCARCHDHKYDPVSAKDYYALYGIMQSTKWAFPGGESQKRPAHFPPTTSPAETAKLEKEKSAALSQLDGQLNELKRQQAALNPNALAGGPDLGFESQTSGKPLGKPWFSAGPIDVATAAQSPFRHIHPQGKVGVRVGSGKPTDGLRYVFANGLRATDGKQMHFTIDFRPVAPSPQKGAFRFFLGRGVVQSLAIECSATSTEFAIRNGSKWEVIRKLTPGEWCTLQITIDPKTKKYSGVVGTLDDLTTFENKNVGPNWDGVADCFICDAFGHIEGPACARDIDNVGLQEAPFAKPGSSDVAPQKTNEDAKQQLAKLAAEIKALQTRRKAVDEKPAYPVAYGVAEGSPKNARLQLRGEPHRLADEIPRRNLRVLGGDLVVDASGSGRLELANWITRPANPLTARVFVNRVWQWHFGQGIVATPSDFGARGERPTHPELLDWLAAEFIATGWSLKSLHRMIMNSNTYQMASDDDPAGLAADPANRWRWRYSRRPLDAESIRDAMLAVSGKLDREAPSAHPFPPVNTWGFTIHRPFHAVYDSDHRSVYLMVQRNRRHPYLALFDAADPNQSVAERLPTTTPTQALFLMNSPFVHEQAEGFANRIGNVAGGDREKIVWAFETAHGRSPNEDAIRDASAFVNAYQNKLMLTRAASGVSALAAKGKAKLKTNGSPRQPSSADQHAAWAALARVLLTSNAFLFVD